MVIADVESYGKLGDQTVAMLRGDPYWRLRSLTITSVSMWRFLRREMLRTRENAKLAFLGAPEFRPFLTEGLKERKQYTVHMRLARIALRLAATLSVFEYPVYLVALGVSIDSSIDRGVPAPEPVLLAAAIFFGIPLLLAGPLCSYAKRNLRFGEVHRLLVLFGRTRQQVGIQRVLDWQTFEPGTVSIGTIVASRPTHPGWGLFRNYIVDGHAYISLGRLPENPEERKEFIEENRSVLIQLIAEDLSNLPAEFKAKFKDPSSHAEWMREQYANPNPGRDAFDRTFGTVDVKEATTRYGHHVVARWTLTAVNRRSGRTIEADGLTVHVVVASRPDVLTHIMVEDGAPPVEVNPGATGQYDDFLSSVRIDDNSTLVPLGISYSQQEAL